MSELGYKDRRLRFSGFDLEQLARDHGTPSYVYSEAQLRRNCRRLKKAFPQPGQLRYALKANSNPDVLRLLAAEGCGADVVSIGEMRLAMTAGIPAERIVFAGVGKRDDEILAALQAGIAGLNVESEAELDVIGKIARENGLRAHVGLRFNPDIDIHGHPYIATGRGQDKFGIPMARALELLDILAGDPSRRLVGLHVHVGSMIRDIDAYRSVGERMREVAIAARHAGHTLSYLDVGGGLGIDYEDVLKPASNAIANDAFCLDPEELAGVLAANLGDLDIPVLFEPGRCLAANAGVLLTRVVYVKGSAEHPIVVVDAGMNDLIRPSLYQAYHEIVPVVAAEGDLVVSDIVGPICESGDFLARNRMMPAVKRGDVLAVLSSGAYGYTLSSNYNARPRAAELYLDGEEARVSRPRERLDDIWR